MSAKAVQEYGGTRRWKKQKAHRLIRRQARCERRVRALQLYHDEVKP